MYKKKRKRKMKRRNNLAKYDAPLSIQFKKGQHAFFKNKGPMYNRNTMQHREWQRGYNFAFFNNLERIKKYEARRRSKRVS